MRYERVLAIAAGMAVVSLSAGLTMLLCFLVVGIPLLFAMTAFVYLLAMYPAVKAKRARRPIWVVALVLIFGVASVAYGVPLLAQARFVTAERALQGDDFEKPLAPVGENIEIVLQDRDYNMAPPATRQAPCGDLCQALLRRNTSNTVYVTNPSKPVSVAYTMGGKDCSLENKGKPITTYYPLEHCFAGQEVPTVPRTALTITATKLRDLETRRQNWSFKPWWLSTVVKIDIVANQIPVASKTYLEGEVASAPLYFDYSFYQGVMDESRLHRAAFPTWQNRTIQDLSRLGGL